MPDFDVVVNDCAAVPVVGGPLAVRSRGTGIGSQNYQFNFSRLVEGLPRQLLERELDFIETAGHIFAIDLACKRGDGDVAWPRNISAHLPVRNPDYWNSMSARIEHVFADLTADRLTLEFVKDESPTDPPRQSRNPFPSHDCVALFSGGVDSFVGTAQLVDLGRRPIAVSHTPAGSITHAQAECEDVIRDRHADFRRLGLTSRKSGQSFPSPPEASQRSRSLLFLIPALVVAAVGGANEVYLNENGIMAIHLPMTQARIGSLSTHTAAPTVLEKVAALGSEVLEEPLAIRNNLLTRTKPSVVALGVELGLDSALASTVSCWSIGRTSQHCGVCAPCIMRRISFELHSVPDAAYIDDAFSDQEVLSRPFAADNMAHMMSLLSQIESGTDLELQLDYPELLNGDNAISVGESIALYRTWADEALGLLRSYPNPRSLL